MIFHFGTSHLMCQNKLLGVVGGVLGRNASLIFQKLFTGKSVFLINQFTFWNFSNVNTIKCIFAKHLYQHTLTSTQIDITFSSKVKVTMTDLVKPALSIFLSEVGLKRRKLSLIEFNFRLVGRWVSGWVLGRFKCFSSQWIFFCWCHVTARACRNRFLPFYF